MVIQESPVPTGAASAAGCNIRLANSARRVASTTNKASQIQTLLVPLVTAGLTSIKLGGARSVGLGLGLGWRAREMIKNQQEVGVLMRNQEGSCSINQIGSMFSADAITDDGQGGSIREQINKILYVT